MRVVLQRVKHACVRVDEEIVSQIKKGFLALIAIHDTDEKQDLDYMSRKITNLRVFSDDEGKMNRSIQDINGEILLVSQFTLFAETKKGNRPSFMRSAHPEKAKEMLQNTTNELQKIMPNKIQQGLFGADMKIELLNDGPVTIIIDSQDKTF